MVKKAQRQPPPPLPSPEEADALEKKLRQQIDSWALYQTDKASPSAETWIHRGPPGIGGRARALAGEFVGKLLPEKKRRT